MVRDTDTVRLGVSLLVSALLAGVMLLVGAAPALACSCSGAPLADYADEVTLAFSGTQVDRDVEDQVRENGAVLTFEVDQVFRGDVGSRIEVRTNAQGSACGLDLAGAGTTGLVTFDSDEFAEVHLCGSSVAIADLEAVFGPGAAADDLGGVESEDEMSIAVMAVAIIAAMALVAGAVALVRRRRRF